MKIVYGAILLTIGVLIGILSTQLLTAVQYPLGANTERVSPADHIDEDHIEVYTDRVVIRLDDPKWATFADTNSMDPIFDKGNNAIQIIPNNPDQIAVGDIISYRTNGKVIIHRVIEKGIDGEGWYFIAKGDNNPVADPGKVRFEDITRLTVAVIY
jgi:hypothetical protein